MANQEIDVLMRRGHLRWSLWVASIITATGGLAAVFKDSSWIAALSTLLLDFPGAIIGLVAGVVLPPHQLEGLDFGRVAWIVFPANWALWFGILFYLRRAFAQISHES